MGLPKPRFVVEPRLCLGYELKMNYIQDLVSDSDKAPDNPRRETEADIPRDVEEWGDWVGVGPAPPQQATVSNLPGEPSSEETVAEKADESSPPTNEGPKEPIGPSHTVIILEPAPDPEINEAPVSVKAHEVIVSAPAADVEPVHEVGPAKVEDAKEEPKVVELVVPAVEPTSQEDEPHGELETTGSASISAASSVPVVPDVEEVALEPVPSVEARVEVGNEIAEEVVEPKIEVKPEVGLTEQEKPADAEEKSAPIGDSSHEG